MITIRRKEWSKAPYAGGCTIWVRCPKCDQLASVSEHLVSEAGHIAPGVLCCKGDCEYDDTVLLAGYAA